MEKPDVERTRIELLEGEAEIDKLGDERYGLLLTNKRMIRSSREGRTNTTTIAFLQDIVTAGVAHTGRNRALLFFGILLRVSDTMPSGLAQSPTITQAIAGDVGGPPRFWTSPNLGSFSCLWSALP
jgi:hypothetical protein